MAHHICIACGGSKARPNQIPHANYDVGIRCTSTFHDEETPVAPAACPRCKSKDPKQVGMIAAEVRCGMMGQLSVGSGVKCSHPFHSAPAPSPHTMGFSEGEPIDLRTLQRMNLARVAGFGMAIEDWTPMAWGSELAEEVGEFQREVLLLGSVLGKVLGAVKKRSRVPHPTEPGKDISGKPVPSLDAVAAELADVVIVTNLLASRLGVDLNNAVRLKWNATSAKVGWPERL